MNTENTTMTQTYEAWRITYQSSEQAARAAFDRMMELEQGKCLHQIAEPAAQAPDDAQIKALMRKHRLWIEHSTLLEDDKPERELRAVQAEEHQFNAFLQDLIAATQRPAVQQAVQPAVPEGEYLEGVHIPTLREALTFLGSENGVGEGEVGGKLPKYVNSISRGVLRCKEMLRTATLTLKASLPEEQEDLIEEIIERISDHAECVIAHREARQQGNAQAIETARQAVFRSNDSIKLDLRKLAAATPHSAEGAQSEANQFDVNTSNGARGYVAWHFSNVIGRHDFKSYIENTLAADFACALAKWLSTATHPTQQGLDARDAAFEAVRKAFCKIQRYSFFLDNRGNVRRCADHCGNWVEFEAVHTLFEPQCVDAALAAQAKQGGAYHG